jgi:DNA-binding response OmpR family regulator
MGRKRRQFSREFKLEAGRQALTTKGSLAAVALTRKEFGTLRFLIARAGEVVSRSELLEEVWDYQEYPTTRTVDNHVASLRSKIERNAAHPKHLLTVHGVGYKFLR